MINILYFIPIVGLIVGLFLFILKSSLKLIKSIYKIPLGKGVVILILPIIFYYFVSNNFDSIKRKLQKEKVTNIHRTHNSKDLKIEFFDEVKKKNYFWD